MNLIPGAEDAVDLFGCFSMFLCSRSFRGNCALLIRRWLEISFSEWGRFEPRATECWAHRNISHTHTQLSWPCQRKPNHPSETHWWSKQTRSIFTFSLSLSLSSVCDCMSPQEVLLCACIQVIVTRGGNTSLKDAFTVKNNRTNTNICSGEPMTG